MMQQDVSFFQDFKDIATMSLRESNRSDSRSVRRLSDCTLGLKLLVANDLSQARKVEHTLLRDRKNIQFLKVPLDFQKPYQPGIKPIKDVHSHDSSCPACL